jgi:restriction system protein
MTAWRDYQESAAHFFRVLGMDASVGERLTGARGHHDVDVVVRASRAGIEHIEQLWIVECKLWRRSVDKLYVAALVSIVQDVGADRGFLLSETGFRQEPSSWPHSRT